MMNAITPNDAVSDAAILRAAEALVARLGADAAAEAANRAAALAQAARWPEHDVALRVLTAVEHLLEFQP